MDLTLAGTPAGVRKPSDIFYQGDPFAPVPAPVAQPGQMGGPVIPGQPAAPTNDGGGGYGAPAPLDYQALINADPLFLQAQRDAAAQGVSDVATRNAGIRRATAQFGMVPGASDWGSIGLDPGIIDPATQQLAQENTSAGLSTTARLQQAHDDQVRQITNALAARGLLRSGETGFQLGRENLNFTRGSYDATQKLLDYFSGLQGALAQADRARQSQLAAAAAAAAGRIPTYYPSYGGGGGGGQMGEPNYQMGSEQATQGPNNQPAYTPAMALPTIQAGAQQIGQAIGNALGPALRRVRG